MSSIRFLSGPLAGKQLPLRPGRNVIGRAPHCDVMIPSQNVSKEHAILEVYNDKIIISDMNSRNGTFVNGVQIKNQKLVVGDRFALFDIICEISYKVPTQIKPKKKVSQPQQSVPPPQNFNSNLAYDQFAQPQMQGEVHAPVAQAIAPQSNLLSYLKKYVDDVVMPGVYKLPEWMEFRTVLGLFVGAFIVFVTTLSTVPLMRILKASVEQESMRRATTIARNLAEVNKSAIMQGISAAVSTQMAENEPGVSSAFVISSVDGTIIAPAARAGQYVQEYPFVNSARKNDQPSFEQIDDSTIGAAVPIKFYNPATGSQSVTAHAVVIYNMGTLAVDNNRTLSLFVQILFIAIITGLVLFFFLYKVIQHPIVQLNEQVNLALRDGHTQVGTTYQFPELHLLATNINSALSRGGGGFAGDQLQTFEADRTREMQSLINLVGFAAIAINPNDRAVSAVNEHFIGQIGQQGQWANISLDKILDQALKLNLISLTDRVVGDPTNLATDALEISNQNYDLSAQGIYGSKTLAYVIVVFVPKGGGA